MNRPLHDIDLKLLRIFREVARQEGFSQAAESLGTSLSNISMNVAQLESRLEMRLCERGVKGFRLTTQGEAILAASDELYRSMDRYQEEVDRISDNMHREFRIGVLQELIMEETFPLHETLARMEKKSPGISFYLEFGPAIELKDKVESGELHSAIGYFDSLPSSFTAHFLARQRHLCYCGRDHELFDKAEEDLAEIDLQQYRIAGYDDFFETDKENMPLFARYDSCSRACEGILSLVRTGNYIGIMVDKFADPYVEKGEIRHINKPELELWNDIELIYKTQLKDSPTITFILEGVNGSQ